MFERLGRKIIFIPACELCKTPVKAAAGVYRIAGLELSSTAFYALFRQGTR